MNSTGQQLRGIGNRHLLTPEFRIAALGTVVIGDSVRVVAYQELKREREVVADARRCRGVGFPADRFKAFCKAIGQNLPATTARIA